MRKFIALPRVGRLAFTTCVVVFALAASARAEDSSLTDKQKWRSALEVRRGVITKADVATFQSGDGHRPVRNTVIGGVS